MIRDGFEKGLASVVARWMLQGGAESVLDRVAKSGALHPEQLEKLRKDTLDHLIKVREDGAPYADMATAALREIAGHLPLGAVFSGVAAAAHNVPWQAAASEATQAATRMALQLAAKSAQAAADRATDLAAQFADKPQSPVHGEAADVGPAKEAT